MSVVHTQPPRLAQIHSLSSTPEKCKTNSVTSTKQLLQLAVVVWRNLEFWNVNFACVSLGFLCSTIQCLAEIPVIWEKLVEAGYCINVSVWYMVPEPTHWGLTDICVWYVLYHLDILFMEKYIKVYCIALVLQKEVICHWYTVVHFPCCDDSSVLAVTLKRRSQISTHFLTLPTHSPWRRGISSCAEALLCCCLPLQAAHTKPITLLLLVNKINAKII